MILIFAYFYLTISFTHFSKITFSKHSQNIQRRLVTSTSNFPFFFDILMSDTQSICKSQSLALNNHPKFSLINIPKRSKIVSLSLKNEPRIDSFQFPRRIDSRSGNNEAFVGGWFAFVYRSGPDCPRHEFLGCASEADKYLRAGMHAACTRFSLCQRNCRGNETR